MSRVQTEGAAPRVRVRIVNVKMKARRWGIIAGALAALAAIVLLLLIGQRIVSAGLWMAPFVVLPLVCAGVSFYFHRNEQPQPRRLFD